MTGASGDPLSERLRHLTAELRALDLTLKAGVKPDPMLLREFRQVLDNVRMTAWTVSELLNAAETQKNPETVLSFLSAERLRRANQLLKDLSTDIDQKEVSWQTTGIQPLYDSVNALQAQLRIMIHENRPRFESVSEPGQKAQG